MPKIDPRDALEVLTRARLIELDVKKSHSKDELLDALLRNERGSTGRYEAVLEVVGRSELEAICRANGLSDERKEK